MTLAEQTALLLRTAYLLCYDLTEAEDLVQETWFSSAAISSISSPMTSQRCSPSKI